MDSIFGMNFTYSGRVSSVKRKRRLPYFMTHIRTDSYENCLGDDFKLCDRRGCPNPYHPSCVKRQKVSFEAKEENLNCGEDKISALPDSIIYHILSFVSIKDAATTSILSKRWRPLWLSQLILNLDDEPFPDSNTFCNLVYSILAMRDITLPILSFHLECCNYAYYFKDIYNFVHIAIQRGVENLNIDFSNSHLSTITLPSFVLVSKTLSVLKLKKITLNQVPYVDLASLKSLHLEHVTFTFYEYILKLLSGCPILQDLEIKNLHVESPYSYRQVLCLSNLVRASICDIHIEFDWLQNVERLRAMVRMEKFPFRFDRIAMFHNLTYMELIINSQYYPRTWMFNHMKKLLEYCPKLQSLIIDEDTTCNQSDEDCDEDEDTELKKCVEDMEEPQIISKCLLSHLTTCSLRNYKGMNCDLHFAKYIMKNSRVLSAMTIESSKYIDIYTKHQILMELSSCLKISSTCKLSFR